MKSILLSSVLLLMPALAFADCTGSESAAMSCADGTAFDHEKGACIPVTG